MKIGLIGNGTIAKYVAKFCATRPDEFTVVGAVSLPSDVESVGEHPLLYSWDTLRELEPDLVVECAGHEAVSAYGAKIVGVGIDLVIVSTGSLANSDLYAEIKNAAERTNAQVKLPSGALPGIDALAAGRLGGLSNVSLRSSKPPFAWMGTPAEKTHDLALIDMPTVVFSGNAREAALAFPKNANVAATAALAGLGFEKTMVTLMADPGLTLNVHHLEANGAFGRLALEIHAYPSPDNPKTSHIAALSIVRLLQNETAAIVI